jgi:hypothetical protein
MTMTRTALGFPLPDGTAVRYEKMNAWVDDVQGVTYVRYVLRHTKEPLPGMTGIVRPPDQRSFALVSLDATGEKPGFSTCFGTRVGVVELKDLSALIQEIVAGTLPFKDENWEFQKAIREDATRLEEKTLPHEIREDASKFSR